jgi:hypothetical protein
MRARSLLALALAVPGTVRAQRPPWARLDSLVVGGPVDAVFPLGMTCRPGTTGLTEGIPALQLATMAFGNAFAHSHRSPEASRRALERVTVCVGRIWNERAWTVVLAMQRRIAAISVFFATPQDTIPADTVRRWLRRRWGRGEGNEVLEEWWHDRYRAYLLNGGGSWDRRAVAFDVRACSLFDRLLHDAGEPGTAVPC